MFRSMKVALGAAAFATAAAWTAAPALADPTLIATIYGEYDSHGVGDLPSGAQAVGGCAGSCSGDYDTPMLFFVNPTDYVIGTSQMVLSVGTAQNSGQMTLNNGLSQTVGLGDIAPHSILAVAWGSSGPLFNYDYDDNYGWGWIYQNGHPYDGSLPYDQPIGGGNTLAGNSGSFAQDCTLNAANRDPEWSNFCAPTGNFLVQFSGTLHGVGPFDGQNVASVFYEYDVNGHYVGWEGLDPLGWSENATYDDHNGVVSGVLANIYLGTVDSVPTNPEGTPEPSSLLIMGGALAIAGLRKRMRRN